MANRPKAKPATKPAVKAEPSVAKSTEMRRRRQRIREMYLHRGYRPPEIADILIDENLATGMKRDALLRFVQDEVKSIREEAEPNAIIALQRPAETERYKQQILRAMREALDRIEDDEEIERQVVTPKGDVMTVLEMRTSIPEKNKALKTYAALAEKLALVNGVDIKGDAVETLDPEKKKRDEAQSVPFQFVTSGKPIDDLISLNIESGKVN